MSPGCLQTFPQYFLINSKNSSIKICRMGSLEKNPGGRAESTLPKIAAWEPSHQHKRQDYVEKYFNPDKLNSVEKF